MEDDSVERELGRLAGLVESSIKNQEQMMDKLDTCQTKDTTSHGLIHEKINAVATRVTTIETTLNIIGRVAAKVGAFWGAVLGFVGAIIGFLANLLATHFWK